MPSRATLIILDGARPDVFRHLVERGDLPQLSQHLLTPGGITPATTVFPSTTGVAYLPLLTGCYPGTCDVPGIRWLDRRHYGGAWWRDREHVRSYCGYQGGRLNDDLPDHASLRCTGWKTLIRDDISEEFDHLANLQRVVMIRDLLSDREKVGPTSPS